jgi:H+/Cl- antiporter ClcA
VIKSLASALSIGTGAAVGREGPIIQIGAALGSTLGQMIRMAPWQRITLVAAAAGAGAGIAATFSTPIGGVMFAIELMMPELSARTFLPVALATGTATFIGRIYFGIHPTLAIPTEFLTSQHPATFDALILFALLGALIGLAATAFVRGLTLAEELFEHIQNRYLRHVVGMLALGILIYVLFRTAGHYYVEGVGYSTIQAVLTGGFTLPSLLILLFVAKLCATSISLGSGSSGGIFSPALFMGATIGGAFGALLTAVHPVEGVTTTTSAIVGMAAMVGGGTGAAMTAVTMIFEMTRDYDLVMPSIVAVALAIGTRRLLSVENIYTIKLVGRGHFVPKALHANMFLVRRAGAVMERDVTVVSAEADSDAFLRQHANEPALKHDRRNSSQPHCRRSARQHRPAPRQIDPARALAETEAFWRDRTSRGQSADEWSEPVMRSLITLKALTYRLSGAIAAAPTTSLPERLGGTRNISATPSASSGKCWTKCSPPARPRPRSRQRCSHGHADGFIRAGRTPSPALPPPDLVAARKLPPNLPKPTKRSAERAERQIGTTWLSRFGLLTLITATARIAGHSWRGKRWLRSRRPAPANGLT